MTRLLLWIGDIFDRDDCWDGLCFSISQWFYALAWRVGKLDQETTEAGH